RRIGMRSGAEHDIEQDDGGFRVGGFGRDALIAQAMVDHRMRTAAREHIVAKIEQGVALTSPYIFERRGAADRRVGKDRLQRLRCQHRGLEAERTAAIKAANVTLTRRGFWRGGIAS